MSALVVTDFNMPQMNGLELLDILKRVHPSLPVLLATADSNFVRSMAIERGATAVYDKSRDVGMLADFVASIVLRKRDADEPAPVI